MNVHIASEFAYLTARGGIVMPCDGGYVIENAIVRETGDYNAFFANDIDSLDRMRKQVSSRLEHLQDDGDTRIQILSGESPPQLPHTTNCYWISHSTRSPSTNLSRIHPTVEDYWHWYEATARAYPDFLESWWPHEQQSHRIFTAHFKPVWYLRGSTVVARLYRHEALTFTRLFSIVVDQAERGQGYGREVIQNEVAISQRPVVIRAQPRLERFYQQAGFAIDYRMHSVPLQVLGSNNGLQ